MAKVKPRPVVPQAGYSPGYTWMLLLTVLAMAGGAALLYVELDSDYGFVSEPKGLSPIPKVKPLPPRDTPKGLTRAPLPPLDDRAAAKPEPTPAERPRTPGVGPFIVRIPPSLPLPGIQTR